jgi:peptidoglycan-N-acetylglucosamine deacetylase
MVGGNQNGTMIRSGSVTKRWVEAAAAAALGCAAIGALLVIGRGAAASLLAGGRLRPAAELLARQECLQESGLRVPELVRGNRNEKNIALTFDDGPHERYTQELLAILKRENVKATFFVVGKMVDAHPELVQQEVADGHEVANHTYNHLRLPTLSPARIEEELRNGAAAIQRAVGSPTRLYRPPGGEYDDNVIAAARRLGYIMVLWTDDPGDFAMPGARNIEERALASVTDGEVLLLHDGVQQTLDILPDMIRRLRLQGFRFVTCSQMARERGIITTGGPRVVSALR